MGYTPTTWTTSTEITGKLMNNIEQGIADANGTAYISVGYGNINIYVKQGSIGTYSKTTWANGSTALSPANLNKIEDGIEAGATFPIAIYGGDGHPGSSETAISFTDTYTSSTVITATGTQIKLTQAGTYLVCVRAHILSTGYKVNHLNLYKGATLIGTAINYDLVGHTVYMNYYLNTVVAASANDILYVKCLTEGGDASTDNSVLITVVRFA